MRFAPMQNEKDESVYADEVFDVGEYEFKVVFAQDTKSKADNDMIKLAVVVFGNGKQIKVYDYLLEAMKFKLKHFCETTGLEQAYSQGNLSPQMCVGKTGRLKLKIQHDETGKYPDKNIIEDYCTEEEVAF